jgi:hypothetical protein
MNKKLTIIGTFWITWAERVLVVVLMNKKLTIIGTFWITGAWDDDSS